MWKDREDMQDSTAWVRKVRKSTSEIAVDLFKKYRLSHGVLNPDILIASTASTALTLEIPFLSKNRKDFRFIKKLDLIEYTV